jgi:hypothetical protein
VSREKTLPQEEHVLFVGLTVVANMFYDIYIFLIKKRGIHERKKGKTITVDR